MRGAFRPNSGSATAVAGELYSRGKVTKGSYEPLSHGSKITCVTISYPVCPSLILIAKPQLPPNGLNGCVNRTCFFLLISGPPLRLPRLIFLGNAGIRFPQRVPPSPRSTNLLNEPPKSPVLTICFIPYLVHAAYSEPLWTTAFPLQSNEAFSKIVVVAMAI